MGTYCLTNCMKKGPVDVISQLVIVPNILSAAAAGTVHAISLI